MNDSLLGAGLTELGLDPSSEQLHSLAVFVEELELWNRRLNLVAARGDDIIVRHLLDSLAGLAVIQRLAGSTLLDAGSGAGFPGIPLSVFLPGVAVTLLDRSAKRAAFLSAALAVMGAVDATVCEAELEGHRAGYDLVCTRAFRPLPGVVEALIGATRTGGSVVAYKGKLARIRAELDETWSVIGGELSTEIMQIHVPFLDEERHLVVIRDPVGFFSKSERTSR